jgi:hypothetical protein
MQSILNSRNKITLRHTFSHFLRQTTLKGGVEKKEKFEKMNS